MDTKQPAAALRWGYIDRDGALAVPFQFEVVYGFSEGKSTVRYNGQMGCIDTAGLWIIPPVFDRLGPFSGGLASARRDGAWGYVNPEGDFVIAPSFDHAYGFYGKDCARIELDDLYGYIDRLGRIILPPRFSDAEEFQNGLARVREPGSDDYWFIDHSGLKALGPFQMAEDFSEGWARVFDNKGSRFINAKGETMLLLPNSVYADRFREGLAAAQDKGEQREKYGSIPFGYINRNGNWVIRPQFEFTFGFRNGVAKVRVPGKREGMIDKQGRFVVPPEFDKLEDLVEGRINFVQNELEGYLDEAGRVVIEPVYYSAQDYSEGLAAVCREMSE